MNNNSNSNPPQAPKRQSHLRLIKTTEVPQSVVEVSSSKPQKSRMELVNQLERLAKSIEDDIALILRT